MPSLSVSAPSAVRFLLFELLEGCAIGRQGFTALIPGVSPGPFFCDWLTRAAGLSYHSGPAKGFIATDSAEVAELADARDSKSRGPCGHEGSTPSFGTMILLDLHVSPPSPPFDLLGNKLGKKRCGRPSLHEHQSLRIRSNKIA